MRATTVTATDLAENDLESHGKPLSVIDAQREVARWWDAGARGYGKAGSLAELAFMSEGQMSKTRQGQQPFKSPALASLKGDVGGTLGFCGPMLSAIDHIAVPARVDVVLTSEHVQFFLEMRESLGPVAFDAVLARFAVRFFACEPELLRVAFAQHLKLGK